MSVGETAAELVHLLQGARTLPAEEAVAKLRKFIDALDASGRTDRRLVEARAALNDLAQALDSDKAASDDTWQKSLQAVVSLANETI